MRLKQQIVPHTTDDTLNEGINEGINEVLKLIVSNEGIGTSEIVLLTKKSQATVERYIKILRERNLIERRGSKKTGGYYKL